MRGRPDERREKFQDAALGVASALTLSLVCFVAGRLGAPRGAPGPAVPEAQRAPDSSRPASRAEAAQPGRGRQAESPRDMPVAGWRDVLLRTYKEFNDDRLMLVAAGVTFYVLLALFPAISALISVYGLFTDPAALRTQLDVLSGILPSGAMDIVGEQMTRVATQADRNLSFGMIFGLGVALWSANAGMKTLFDALNIVYDEEEKRSFVRLNLIALACTLLMLVFVVIALSSVVLLPVVIEFLHLGAVESWLLLLRWPVLLVVVALGLSAIYRTGPSRENAKWRWLTWGAAFAAVMWVAFSILFSWYVQNFGSYDETYGSLGAAIGFMTWIWISTMVVLLGAEINAELEHQTEHDTTTEGPAPMGSRGATMADTLGRQP